VVVKRLRTVSVVSVANMRCGGVDSIDLAEDKDWWRAPVSAVMNLGVP
jgi:hypothetical protein